MASISTCFFTPTPKFKLKPQSAAFYPKPFFRLHSIRLQPSLHFSTNLKLRRSAKRSLGLVRASSLDVTTSAIKPGAAVESDKLPSDVRNRAMDAIDSFGGRVTVGDVASKAGLKLNEAQKALQALAADTDGFLEVSDEGDVLYVFPKDYRAKLTAKSFRMRIEPVAEKAKLGAEYLVRVSFGTALIASIVIVFTTIVAILSSRSEDDNRRGRGRSYGGGFSVNFFPSDLFWYWDPYYYRRRRMRDESTDSNFIESVFSFVFGDGDPNQGIEEERWKLIGEYIASNGGVVTAEELAPFLDVETEDKTDDDSYVLPVLLRFEGQPELDEEGNILYRFPSIQRTAAPGRRGKKEYLGRKWANLARGQNFFKENKWSFSKTNASERAMVIGLGGLNLFGVIVLGTMLNTAVEPGGFISFVSSIFPLLQIYAGSFFAIPLFRWFSIQRTNAKIEKRNKARESRARVLELPDVPLRRKLLNARDMAERTYIGQDRIVYSTEKDFVEQDYDAQEWDRRFREMEKSD
ncbi:OLC1v1034211C1 [Oldenlandia corymbosa var. corymbosa]|uniref:OLC1v1034211C1 n=1 Tax=Oldenlandia corymbosa var. corymbosa TaxID=529605 RepID=A0AAV1CQ88_OLDCO|nr:OLC1v1034211C1 [Oldenlandia corymbosa var. corymbosa]